ncbi:MAG: GIY-YIG nuclease family protein [Thermoplasmatota archaeon]
MPPDAPGTYVLELELPSPADVAVGALGMLWFAPGVYAYVGSAMNGLRRRIARHLRADKKTYWHIDYLLREATVARVWHVAGEQRECDIAAPLSDRFDGVAGFGCSDCRCRSHLFFCGDAGRLSRGLAALGLTASTPDAWR